MRRENKTNNYYFPTLVIQSFLNNFILKVPGVGRDNLNVEYTTVERGCKYEKIVNGVKTVFPSGPSLPHLKPDHYNWLSNQKVGSVLANRVKPMSVSMQNIQMAVKLIWMERIMEITEP